MSCYEITPKYRTADGKLHDTPEQACKHVEEVMCSFINRIVQQTLTSRGESAALAIPITETIYLNRKAIRDFLNMEVAFPDDWVPEE